MAARWCVVPDLDDELVFALRQAEEALLGLDGWAAGDIADVVDDVVDDDPDNAGEELPALQGWVPPLADRAALEAVERIAAALRPTQGPSDRPGLRQLGPDGRYEHTPLRFVLLEQEDLDALAGAAQLLGRHVVLRPHSELAEGAAAAAAYAGLSSGRDLVELLARLHGALDLEWTADAGLLRARVAGPAGTGPAAGGDVVFSGAEEAAYQRLVDRFNGMWGRRRPARPVGVLMAPAETAAVPAHAAQVDAAGPARGDPRRQQRAGGAVAVVVGIQQGLRQVLQLGLREGLRPGGASADAVSAAQGGGGGSNGTPDSPTGNV